MGFDDDKKTETPTTELVPVESKHDAKLREYYEYVTMTQNEHLDDLLEPKYELYYFLYMYCRANSSYLKFPFRQAYVPKEYVPKIFEKYLCRLNADDKKFMISQIAFVNEDIIKNYPRI